MSYPGKVYSAEEIYESIWEETAINTETIMVHVRRLREKIEANPKHPEYLKAVWGVGYKIEKDGVMTMKKRRIFIIGLIVLLLACPSQMIYITVKQQDGYKKRVADNTNEYMPQFLTMAVESKTDPDYKP